MPQIGTNGGRAIADMTLEDALERGALMVSAVAPINPAPAITADTTVAAPTAKPQDTAQSAVPQDTVTISDQAQSIPASAATPSLSPSLISSLSSSASPSSSSSASLAVQEQMQALANQGWSVNQIASNLNVAVSTVEQYVSAAQAAGTSNPTAAPATTPRIPL
jgi:DNA-binding NarL/FixJ family response regulator